MRLCTGNPSYRTEAQAKQFRQLTYTCLQDILTRTNETLSFPKKPCPAGIMVNVRFPTCWDGVNLDSPDHMSHVAYPARYAAPLLVLLYLEIRGEMLQ
jgi:hypothetical protein